MRQRPRQSPPLRDPGPQHLNVAPPANVQRAQRSPQPSGTDGTNVRAAARVALGALALALVGGGVIEWAGWQVLYRHTEAAVPPAGALLGVPLKEWALGGVRNALGAVAVGGVAAALALVLPPMRRRPWRSAPVAFAVGVLAALTALGALTAWAP